VKVEKSFDPLRPLALVIQGADDGSLLSRLPTPPALEHVAHLWVSSCLVGSSVDGRPDFVEKIPTVQETRGLEKFNRLVAESYVDLALRGH
jgi:hypothetical protein